MSKYRRCDRCGIIIKSKEEYIKCCSNKWDGNRLKLINIGELCMKCWDCILDKELKQKIKEK